eukprot:CAMPEP_0177690524 /NCGR_PEP_ID=MMETSP0484_2-20121128/812_1 /TAXON_ID=354590 /ORGANISM="Rhodomonas lens, Strain RHODO" /LENGTH=365 /DNA_ID=CAMNT_0019201073 /DNA_START=10 /DNA_END=1104 /DNA_ORIENTATION=+
MAMLFTQEDGKLIQQNSMARAQFRDLTGRPDGTVSLVEVLDSFVWEDEKACGEMASNIQHLPMGNGDERAFKPMQGERKQESTGERWMNMRFEVTLDPTPGQKDRKAVLVSGKDVSEQRQAQGDLLSLNNQQEECFVEMAHELRTPLHCIAGLAEALQRDAKCPSNMHKNLDLIHSEAIRLSAMVSDVIDNVALKRRTLLIKHENVSLSAVATPLLRRGVMLINEVSPSLPSIQADASRLFQVLVNLVGNSVRFTSKGHIRITGEAIGSPVRSVEVSVQDTGIGIPPSKCKSIFDAYVQVDAGTTREYGGTGLGLALVKALVEAHHGTITASSTHGGPGHGSTFTVQLPLRQPDRSRTSGTISGC